MTLVDVIVLSWNDGPMLTRAVRSALQSTGELQVRVTVVDNASDEEPELPDDPRVRLIRNSTNRGVAGGRNDGMGATDAALVCFLDSDAELAPDSLDRLLEALDSDEQIVLAVPVFSDQSPEASAGRFPTLRVKVERMLGRRNTYEPVPRSGDGPWWDVDFGIGACQLVRRQAFEAVGGLDESLWWADDADFCLRLRRAGGRVVQVGTTRVVHPARRRFTNPLSRRGFRHTTAVMRMLWRHRRRSGERVGRD